MNSSLHHAPYIRHPESCRTIMGDTLISLLPLYFMSYFYYGPRVLVIGAVAVLTCLAADWLCSCLTYRRVNLRDLSAAVTGVIISMLMPPAIDLTVIVVASLFAILVCKAPFGGTGHNIFNPQQVSPLPSSVGIPRCLPTPSRCKGCLSPSTRRSPCFRVPLPR